MSQPSSYRTTTVPVRGGEIAVGVWGPDDAPTILAIHGITASHRSWALLAEAAPELRIIAPDLRGRGRSNRLPGPWGMPTHTADMVAVLDAFGVQRCVVLGHSMGAFVAATLGIRHPATVAELVLVDGGLPLPLPQGIEPEGLLRALIGPAAERLAMRFASREVYREFWRKHPAFANDWSTAVEDYADYDLDDYDLDDCDPGGEAPGFKPASVYAAVAEDSLQLSGDTGYLDALVKLSMPVHFLRAERGILNEPTPLYSTSTVEEWDTRISSLTPHDVSDVNHYTIVMSARGAAEVSGYVRSAIERTVGATSALAALAKAAASTKAATGTRTATGT